MYESEEPATRVARVVCGVGLIGSMTINDKKGAPVPVKADAVAPDVGVAAAICHTVRPASSVPTGEALNATSEPISGIHSAVSA